MKNNIVRFGLLLFVVSIGVVYVIRVSQTTRQNPTSTVSPTSTQQEANISDPSIPSDNESWTSEEEKYANILSNHITLIVPDSWFKTACGTSINLDPIWKDCATEPNAFAVNIQVTNGSPENNFTRYDGFVRKNINKNMFYAGRPAIQFDMEVLEGQAQGTYKIVIVEYDDYASLKVVLNRPPQYVAEYFELLDNLQFQ